MNSALYVRKGFGQRGSSTSAGKLSGCCGFKQRRLAPHEVTDTKLAADIDRGWRHFWARRVMDGIFPDDPDAQHRAGGLHA